MSSRDGKYGSGRWVRNKQLAAYLGVTIMTVWRWKRDPKLNFPPASAINDIEYNDLDQIDAWLKARVVKLAEAEVAA